MAIATGYGDTGMIPEVFADIQVVRKPLSEADFARQRGMAVAARPAFFESSSSFRTKGMATK